MNKQMTPNKKTNQALPFIAVLLSGALIVPALAQTENTPPTATATATVAAKPKAGTKTPEQIELLTMLKLESKTLNLRRLLTDAGFTDKALQAAIVQNFIEDYEAAIKLNQSYKDVVEKMSSPTLSDEEFATQLNAFRDQVRVDTARRQASDQTLVDRFEINKQPTLNLLLVTVGIIGEEHNQLELMGRIEEIIKYAGLFAEIGVGMFGDGMDNWITVAATGQDEEAKSDPKARLEEAKQLEARVNRIRKKLTEAHFTDPKLQNAVVGYYKTKEEATEDLNVEFGDILSAVSKDLLTDTKLAAQFAQFREGVQDEMARREVATSKLNDQIGLTQKPRLDALLMSLGITGDERAIAQSQEGGLSSIVDGLDQEDKGDKETQEATPEPVATTAGDK